MNLLKLVRTARAFVKDPEKDFTERVFMILTFMSEVTVFIALIMDIITHENRHEIITLVITLIVVPTIVLTCFKHNRLGLAIRIIVIGLVFVILPALFFFGGGLMGGGVLWFIFAFMYIGLVLRDKWRKVMFFVLALLSTGCFLLSYFYPQLVYPHTRWMFYVDFFLSLVLVGVLCYIMTWSQSRLFTEEIERAEKEVQRAEELTRSQNRFFSSMSHEIRTPINSILGLNELILRDQSASDEIVRDASSIQGSGKLLLSLINDILDFSKIEAGSMDIVPVDYRVGDMLSEIVNMMWIKAHDKGLVFDVSIDPDVPMELHGDEVRIKQVIINLLNNAIKYTKEGHVGLRVESTDVGEDAVELAIAVTDTGMGIKKEDIPYLFTAFKRVDEGKNRHIEGTGLGLSIVKQLVELMDGSISVDSIYGEGSSFSIRIRQMVTNKERVGELNIHNQQVVRRSVYESRFLAPEVRILIVDDNTMNLEVEKRLLIDTDMAIDTAVNGREALDKCLKIHYDVIFMDHLMPEMDGIECLEKLREQAGGLNRSTPVIILTANAGSENRELYQTAGFDGYLVKPVSGEAMEDVLIQHISSEKIILRNVMKGDDEVIRTSDRYADKIPVIITTSSMCDLPDAVIRKLKIPILPFLVRTEEGVFKDGVHMDAAELIRHVNEGKSAVSFPPDEEAYTDFFADALQKAHHLIHIAISTSMSREYEIACEAAKAFDNVTVINSECVSSATGILVLIACKLVQQGIPVEEIVPELEEMKHRLRCSFVIDSTKFMEMKGLISHTVSKFAEALNLHPALRIRDDHKGIGGIWLGRIKHAYRGYIRRALPPDTIPDENVAFVTYVDIPEETLHWIEEEIRRTAYFERVIFKQASAAISSNCGPGAFGILYFLKSNKSYNLGTYLDLATTEIGAPGVSELSEEEAEDVNTDQTDESFDTDAETADMASSADASEIPDGATDAAQWIRELTCIDADAALKNSGSEDAFKAVLKIFYDTIPDKYEDLETCYTNEDWENYTIKIHALKSSAKLVGALDLSDKAKDLEMAGKGSDVAYIKEHHGPVMEDFLRFMEVLAPLYQEKDEEKPEADAFLIESIYDELRAAAEAMDCGMVEDIMKEIDAYAIPASESEKFRLIREKIGAFDYDGLLEVLNG